MFKIIVIFTKTMAGLIILATGLRGIDLLMVKAENARQENIIQSNVEVAENKDNSISELESNKQENNNSNVETNSNKLEQQKPVSNTNKPVETKTQSNAIKENIKEEPKVNVNENNNTQNINTNNQPKEEKQNAVQQPQEKQEEKNETKQEVVQQPVREVRRNDEMIQKIKNYISTHETERMKKYGYSFVVDPEVVKITHPFTYSEFNMNSCLNRTGEYRVYAQDYYYNGKYVETQCFVY